MGAVLKHEEALGVDVENLVVTTNVNRYKTYAVVLETGSNMQRLGIPGEDKFIRGNHKR